MIRLTTALLLLGVMVAAGTGFAQGQDECWWAGCNREASLCRYLCPRQSDVGGQWQPRPASIYPWHQYRRHAKHQKRGNPSG